MIIINKSIKNQWKINENQWVSMTCKKINAKSKNSMQIIHSGVTRPSPTPEPLGPSLGGFCDAVHITSDRVQAIPLPCGTMAYSLEWISIGILWNFNKHLLEFYENIWKCNENLLEFYGFLKKSITILWKSMKIRRKPIGILRKSMKIY